MWHVQDMHGTVHLAWPASVGVVCGYEKAPGRLSEPVPNAWGPHEPRPVATCFDCYATLSNSAAWPVTPEAN